MLEDANKGLDAASAATCQSVFCQAARRKTYAVTGTPAVRGPRGRLELGQTILIQFRNCYAIL